MTEPQPHWDHVDIEMTRDVSWLSLPSVSGHYVWRFSGNETSLVAGIDGEIKSRFPERADQLRGAAVVCGDMAAEAGYFQPRDGIAFRHVLGLDLSPESLKRAANHTSGIEFEGVVADANRLSLEPGSLDFAVGIHGIHHIHNLGNVFYQLNRALQPKGLLFQYEWIGPPYLQIPRRNAFFTRLLMFSLFNKHQRTNHMGQLKGRFLQSPVNAFDPSEACNSDQLEVELNRYFRPIRSVKFGGIMYPLIEGNAPNIDMTNPTNAKKIKFAIRCERVLTKLGLVRSLFMISLDEPKEFSH